MRRRLHSHRAVCDKGIFTTIHKFMPEKGEAMPELSARQIIVVIADEAHRSQYGFGGTVNEKTGEMSYGFASNLRDALPNAPGKCRMLNFECRTD